MIGEISRNKLKFIFSKKATKHDKIFTIDLTFKVHIFWEGHKILQNLHLTFDCMYCSQKLGEDFAKFCGLLRIYELCYCALAPLCILSNFICLPYCFPAYWWLLVFLMSKRCKWESLIFSFLSISQATLGWLKIPSFIF